MRCRLPGIYPHDAQLDYFRIADDPPKQTTSFLLAAPSAHWLFSSTEAQCRSFGYPEIIVGPCGQVLLVALPDKCKLVKIASNLGWTSSLKRQRRQFRSPFERARFERHQYY